MSPTPPPPVTSAKRLHPDPISKYHNVTLWPPEPHKTSLIRTCVTLQKEKGRKVRKYFLPKKIFSLEENFNFFPNIFFLEYNKCLLKKKYFPTFLPFSPFSFCKVSVVRISTSSWLVFSIDKIGLLTLVQLTCLFLFFVHSFISFFADAISSFKYRKIYLDVKNSQLQNWIIWLTELSTNCVIHFKDL